jgi:predicted ATP-dependent endonuclease of OLD family
MYLYKAGIRNFRLLANVDLFFEEHTTVIVGRNNSGKTSLTELFRRLVTGTDFRLEDFSLSAHEHFWKAFGLKNEGKTEPEIRAILPNIEVRLTVKYEKDTSTLGPLGDFIVDLNPDCTEAVAIIRYQPNTGQIDSLFADIELSSAGDELQKRKIFFHAIKERLSKCYIHTLVAVDPNDPTNEKSLEWSRLSALFQSGFINAQRGLDDTTYKGVNLLGKILESLLTSARSDTADPNDRAIAKELETAVESMQKGIDQGFNKQLQDLLPTFTLFGYPGLSDPQLLTETVLDVDRLLKNHTEVHYAGVNGINLPEAYNGLGVRNLIFMLLKLLEFFKAFMVREGAPGMHLIFIEEPEVHLHPQMQEVFIKKLNDIASVFANKFNAGRPWPVQFVVTTHSSHLANKASFDSMRYFLTRPREDGTTTRATQIKDLRMGLGGIPPEDRDFLHKYMTLTRCDLLFADKAILIEGPTERLMLPKMIQKLEAERPEDPKLSSQYASIVEVGGAYAHLFFGLLEFLELQTLVITDIDAVKPSEGNKLKACRTGEGTRTSNACIKKWFAKADIAPAALLQSPVAQKICGIRRLAYQVPETANGPCGRSFEDAFMLANPGLFELAAVPEQNREAKAWEQAGDVAKTDFAVEYAVQKTDWQVPRYIAEGLRWLAENATRVLSQTATVDSSGDAVASLGEGESNA